ncbi:hypothetical protein IE89_13165 [Heyndrickxia coagulans]|nr:hypothetical protein IE89_13165 [Heyndrickxia coagulans]
MANFEFMNRYKHKIYNVTENDILIAEQRMNLSFPSDLKQFYLGFAERMRFCQIQAKLRLLKYKIVLYKNFKKRTLSFRSRFIIRN